MNKLLLLLFAFLTTPLFAASPIIYYGTHSKDLTTAGLITKALQAGSTGQFNVSTAGLVSTTNGLHVGSSAQFQVDSAGNVLTTGNADVGGLLSVDGNGHSFSFAGANLTSNYTVQVPATSGTVGQYMATDGSGNLSWTSPASNVFKTQSITAVTAVGTAGFPQLGHVLDANDFGAETSTQFTFYNLSANGNDGSTQGINLTPQGTPTFTTANVLGTANAAATLNGTTQYYSSTNAFLNPGNVNFAVGGWFNLTNWTTASKTLFAQANGASDLSFDVETASSGLRMQCTNTAASWDTDVTVMATLAGWHHVALVFDKTNGYCRLYIDGKQANASPQASVRAGTGSNFEIGALFSTDFIAGAVEDVFFINGYAPTADDIRKLAARRFDHLANISPDAQVWAGTWQRADQKVATPLDSWVVDKETNYLYGDFSGVAAGAFVAFKGQSLTYNPTSVSQYSYDSTWLSTTPPTTIAHGMGSIPDNCKVQYTTGYGAAGAMQSYDCGNYCSADATNFYCDWTGLTVNATNTVRLTAWMNGAQTAVTAASASTSGVVNTTSQTFAGAKTFTGRVAAGNSKIRAWMSTDESCAAATTCVVNYNTHSGGSAYDTNSEFDVTTNVGRFTPVSAGYYLITCSATINSAAVADGDSINVFKNGSRLGGGLAQGSGNLHFFATDFVSLNGTTDYVDCRVFNGAAGARTITSNSGDPGVDVFTASQIP